MKLIALLRALFLVVVIVAVVGGVLVWRGILHLPMVGGAKAPVPVAKATRAPFKPPATAPKFDPALDPDAIDPFVVRLAKVNAMARKMIVTNAEYQDNDGGQRYFLAIVTSCKELNEIWPIKKGVLQAKVEGPLALKDDFSIFSFGEFQQSGQWGVVSCDGTI
ncbi:MAG TPA: hypothetical protein VGP41_09415 [Candidatus Lustribacter sp.]|nr:hypothetical protein [Candidatus Lustribacter sp.]